jgi:hypothetical protein
LIFLSLKILDYRDIKGVVVMGEGWGRKRHKNGQKK